MVTRNAVNIWSQVRDKVRNELDNPNYDYLLEGTAHRGREDSWLAGVPSQFARDWLDARCCRSRAFLTLSPVGLWGLSLQWPTIPRANPATDRVKKAALKR